MPLSARNVHYSLKPRPTQPPSPPSPCQMHRAERFQITLSTPQTRSPTLSRPTSRCISMSPLIHHLNSNTPTASPLTLTPPPRPTPPPSPPSPCQMHRAERFQITLSTPQTRSPTLSRPTRRSISMSPLIHHLNSNTPTASPLTLTPPTPPTPPHAQNAYPSGLP